MINLRALLNAPYPALLVLAFGVLLRLRLLLLESESEPDPKKMENVLSDL